MRILFVCLGNICRSPMAEGIFKDIAKSRELPVVVDSAGTGGWHVGEPPDRRAQAKLRAEGIDISKQCARKFERSDFEKFDLIVPMDQQNQTDLLRLADESNKEKILPFADFTNRAGVKEIPDPYYGGEDGFNHVYDLITEAGNGLADFIQARG